MKTTLLGFLLATCLFSLAQNPIPNPGFESWSGGSPTSWTSNNIPTIATPVTQSGSSHSGSSAARLEAVSMFSASLPPTLFLTNPVSISQDYPSFSFYFKGSLNAGDVFQAVFALQKNGTTTGIGSVSISAMNSNVYTFTSVPVIYIGVNSTDADLNFVIGSNNASVTIGTYVIIDDINVGGAVGLTTNGEYSVFSMDQCYPNPVSDFGFIPFSLSSASSVSIELFSIEGKKVMDVLHTELSAGKYKAELDVTSLSQGVYVCKLSADGRTLHSKIAVK